MTPEEQENAADRRATRNVFAAVLLLISILIFLLLAPLNFGFVKSARRTMFGKHLSEQIDRHLNGSSKVHIETGESIGTLPENSAQPSSTTESRPGAAGSDQPTETVGAPQESGLINESLDDRSASTNGSPQALLLDDFTERLQKAGARSGDVQISLEWKNKNDLDLHVFDPFGEEIFYRNRVSKSGGQLDVDMNLVRLDNGLEVAEDIAALTDWPVENVYWPERGAPRGTYRVEVAHYARHGAPDPTAFSVRVINRGQAFYYRGALTQSNPKQARAVVCTFSVQ